MLCAFLFFINHPMVKVKVEDKVAQDAAGVGFNHPMVKVKVQSKWNDNRQFTGFQPPYGES